MIDYIDEYDGIELFDGTVNSELDEIVDNLKSKAKKEFLDRLNKLEKENAELKDIKENYNSKIDELERKYDNRLYKLEQDYKEKERNLYRRPINEIFPFVSKPYYIASIKYDYIPKCDKCNEDRQFVYIDPLNREHKFDCTCKKREFSGYEIEERVINFIKEITIRDGKPQMFVDFDVKENCDNNYIYGNYFDKSKIVPSEKVDELINNYSSMFEIGRYDVMQYYFETKEDCEKVINALNSMLNKVERN